MNIKRCKACDLPLTRYIEPETNRSRLCHKATLEATIRVCLRKGLPLNHALTVAEKKMP